MKYEPKSEKIDRDIMEQFNLPASLIVADLANAEAVIAWQEKEIERLNKLLVNKPCPECGLSHEMHFKSCSRNEKP